MLVRETLPRALLETSVVFASAAADSFSDFRMVSQPFELEIVLVDAPGERNDSGPDEPSVTVLGSVEAIIRVE